MSEATPALYVLMWREADGIDCLRFVGPFATYTDADTWLGGRRFPVLNLEPGVTIGVEAPR